jgi:hypothetical protein
MAYEVMFATQCHSSVENIFIRERGAVSKVNAYG